MTDFLFIYILLVLSSLIGQIDNETGTRGGNETIAVGADASGTEVYEPIVQIIKVGIAAFSLLLLGLSISAYKKTSLKSIIYAAAAFGLFAAQLFFDYLEDVAQSFKQPYNDIIFYAMTLAILVLFFLAIVRRNKT